jgi:hypothetical protein
MDESMKIIEKLKNTKFIFLDEEKKEIEINEKGSLGLLAKGYKGVIALRMKRQLIRNTNKK